jgi:hypothetical protein
VSGRRPATAQGDGRTSRLARRVTAPGAPPHTADAPTDTAVAALPPDAPVLPRRVHTPVPSPPAGGTGTRQPVAAEHEAVLSHAVVYPGCGRLPVSSHTVCRFFPPSMVDAHSKGERTNWPVCWASM